MTPDSQAGFPSQERGVDPTIGKRGSNQILPQGTQHFTPKTSRSNRVQAGKMPKTSGPSFGSPDPVNPLGRGWMSSLES